MIENAPPLVSAIILSVSPALTAALTTVQRFRPALPVKPTPANSPEIPCGPALPVNPLEPVYPTTLPASAHTAPLHIQRNPVSCAI